MRGIWTLAVLRAECRMSAPLRLMVLDASGSVVHRTPCPLSLDPNTGQTHRLPRGEVFLVCAFAEDD